MFLSLDLCPVLLDSLYQDYILLTTEPDDVSLMNILQLQWRMGGQSGSQLVTDAVIGTENQIVIVRSVHIYIQAHIC